MPVDPAQIANAPRGLGLPLRRIPGGYFRGKDPLETAWGDLMIALFSPIGSRPFQRGFGSGLRDLLFEPNTPQVSAEVSQVVMEAAARWTPHVRVDFVNVQAEDDGVSVVIGFGLASDASVGQRKVLVRANGPYDVVRVA